MLRLAAVSIAIVSALIVASYVANAQAPSASKGNLPRCNQVYVKIIWPADPVNDTTNRPAVESWIAKRLKKLGQSKFTAVTDWVPLGDCGFGSYVWDGFLGDKRWVCSVNGRIKERSDGQVEVVLDGWGPATLAVTVSLTDEPGSRDIRTVEWLRTDQGMPYVAVLVCPVAPEGSDCEAGEE